MAWRRGNRECRDRAYRVCGRRPCAGGACVLLPALRGASAPGSPSVDRVASTCEDAPDRGGIPRAQTVLASLRNCARGTPPRPGARSTRLPQLRRRLRALTFLAALRNCARGTPPRPGASSPVDSCHCVTRILESSYMVAPRQQLCGVLPSWSILGNCE